MSCPNSQAGSQIQLSVAVGSLPEGFCPANYQQLAQAIADRLIISSSQNFSTFVTGSQPPTSNVGPWLKNCEEWFIFDDASATYIPISKGGFNQMQYFTASDSFVVPAFIYKLKVSNWGAGAGGSGQFGAGTAGNGGGAGGFGVQIFNVTPGQVIPFTVGTGGAAGVSVGGAGGNGGDTTFLTLVAGGGKASVATAHYAGHGGTVTGGIFSITGGYGQGGEAGVPGAGGISPQGGQGGVSSFGGAPEAADFNGIIPGGGGSGGLDSTSGQQLDGGTGANGACLIEY